MTVIKVASGHREKAIISIAEKKDFKLLTKKRYSFSWSDFRNTNSVYKLQIDGETDILGVISLIDIPEEKRVEIHLLALAKENIGRCKIYDGVAGCLIAFAANRALEEYGLDACISLVPKTQLVAHYVKKYGMMNAGKQLFLSGPGLQNITINY